MSAQWAQFLRVISIASILSCAQSAVLVLMYAQVAQFQKNKLQNWQRQNPRAMLGDFCFTDSQKYGINPSRTRNWIEINYATNATKKVKIALKEKFLSFYLHKCRKNTTFARILCKYFRRIQQH